jgi:glutamate-5-semialdehyde dehydrogenase
VATTDLTEYCQAVAQRAGRAARALATVPTGVKNRWLEASAEAIWEERGPILRANTRDLENAQRFELAEAAIDRLRLDEERLRGIAESLRCVARLDDPIGQSIETQVRPNGLKIEKVRVPLGVVFFIYESRPNVTADAAAICVKSGNAVILRGGKEAAYSSRAIVRVLIAQADRVGLPADAVQLVETPEREAVGHFLGMEDAIDVAIPRGGAGLIRRVVAEARMPVIKHFDGNCHVYVDRHADQQMARAIVLNAKTQRMGVCNACESLLVHQAVAKEFLPEVGRQLRQAGVELRGDRLACQALEDAVPASEEDWGKEYLGPCLSIAVVPSLDAAIEHINLHGSHHTDAIVTRDLATARRFVAAVDSAAVMVNASTRFNDGGEFGFGAEIGISTDKFHARGPCGLRELTSYKYVVTGDGHVRD